MVKLQICCLLMMISGAVNINIAGAQEYVAPPVTISKDKVKLDGKVFYSHIVLEKQTLFSISKAYNVTIDEIYRYNPTVKENGLRKNDIIIIPVVSGPAQESRQQKTIQQSAVYQEPVHPEPVQVTNEVPSNQTGTTYTVSWYDDLNSIAAKFNVSKEAIIAANNLNNRKLRNRQVLIIPAPTEQENTVEEVNAEQPMVSVDKEESESWDYFAEAPSITDMPELMETEQPEVMMSLVLPFKANGKSGSRNNLDFYSGVLMAARELTDNGINFKLKVFDSANDSIKIDIAELKSSDVIIGPVSTKEISMIQTMTAGECPIVSPLDQRVEALASRTRNIIQAPTSLHAQHTDLANWIKEDRQEEDVVIIISEKGARQSDNGKTIISVMDSKGVKDDQNRNKQSSQRIRKRSLCP